MIKLAHKQKDILKKSGVILAYIYGSQARGKTNFLSDVDIAILLDNKINSKKYGKVNRPVA